MRSRIFLASVFVIGCGKTSAPKSTPAAGATASATSAAAPTAAAHPTPAPTLAAPVPLIAHLPPTAQAVFGYNREGSEADVRAYAGMFAPPDLNAPCIAETVAKIDHAVGGFDEKSQVAVFHGAGLRGAVEACLKVVMPKSSVADADGVTTYTIDGDPMSVLWVDGDTLVAGPVTDAAKTAALANVATASAPGAHVGELLARIDQSSAIWGSVTPSQHAGEREGKLGPQPLAAWAQLKAGGASIGVTLKEPDAFGASRAKAAIEKLLATPMHGMPDGLDAVLQTVKLDAQGDEVHGTIDLTPLIVAAGKKLPSSAAALAAIGMIAMLAF